MAQDASKIYGGPITALGIAAAATADGGSYTDIAYMDEEGAANITWTPFGPGLSDGNMVQINGKGEAEFHIVQTDPAGAQATLESYRTTKGKLKITTIDTTNGYYFIDGVFVRYEIQRDFKPGGYHKIIIRVSKVTENQDDFCNGPKAAS
jgi:hypothetical protein